MQKRDRHVTVYVRSHSNVVLMFPYVCYMAGESGPSGDAVELRGEVDPAKIGRRILALLQEGKCIDVDALKHRRMSELRDYWKGHDPSSVAKGDWLGPEWRRILAAFPDLTKGPAAFLRRFVVWQIIERDNWKHRKVVRVEKSESRGCTIDGEVRRISLDAKPSVLGEMVLEIIDA